MSAAVGLSRWLQSVDPNQIWVEFLIFRPELVGESHGGWPCEKNPKKHPEEHPDPHNKGQAP